MIQLPQPASQFRSVLPPGRDLAAWHAALTAGIGQHLTPAHAGVLGTPVLGGAGGARPGEPSWAADGGRARRLADLPAEDRAALLHHLRSVLSDIRRLAESRVAPAVTEAWPALREVPDLACVHAVDGRPVLAAWGHAGPRTGVLAHLDDGVAWQAPARQPWLPWAASLGAVAVLALAAGLLLPAFGGSLVPQPPACTAAPGQLALLRDQAAEEARGRDLRARLAQLAEEVGRRQLQCPLPQAADASRVPPQPPVQPPRRADLPEDAWRRRDIAIFEGCWNRFTNMSVRHVETGRQVGVRSWTLCFDRSGRGRQTIVLDDGRQCENELRATFSDESTAVITDVSQCRGTNINKMRGEATCRRVSEQEADCPIRELEGPNQGGVSNGRFRR